ncbi:alpha-2,8-sialyltransferase 8B-like [Branchiostoma floridae x Branchiostoma belcheri]
MTVATFQQLKTVFLLLILFTATPVFLMIRSTDKNSTSPKPTWDDHNTLTRQKTHDGSKNTGRDLRKPLDERDQDDTAAFFRQLALNRRPKFAQGAPNFVKRVNKFDLQPKRKIKSIVRKVPIVNVKRTDPILEDKTVWADNQTLERIRKYAFRMRTERMTRLEMTGTGKNKDILLCGGMSARQCSLHKKNEIRHYKTCALVGNGGILTDSLCGAEIDSRDYVIRFSLAPVSGYEEDVGTKTNLTVMNVQIIYRVVQSQKLISTRNVYSPRLKRLNGTTFLFFSNAYEKRLLFKQFFRAVQANKISVTVNYVSPKSDVKSILRKIFPGLSRHLGTVMTTGLTAVIAATNFCDEIFLYGYYPYRTAPRGDRTLRYHYYPDDYIQPVVMDKIHNFTTEYLILKELEKRGVVTLITDRCQLPVSLINIQDLRL